MIIQIIHLREKTWLSTSCRLTEAEFDEAAQSARYVKGVNTKQQVGVVNAKIRSMKAEVEEVIADLSREGDFAASDIAPRYKHLQNIEKEKAFSLLLDYAEKRMNRNVT